MNDEESAVAGLFVGEELRNMLPDELQSMPGNKRKGPPNKIREAL
jgi:hypothetical protein